MAKEPSLTDLAWEKFDQIVADAPLADSNPWALRDGQLEFETDQQTLSQLLNVSGDLGALAQSGILALAVDVWTSYELRRAGFHPDRVWPRAKKPRVLPYDVVALVDSLPKVLRDQVQARIDKGDTGGTGGADARLLGKNYSKQVDVVMSSWQTGPELMVSTKTMSSSFAKNAANRIEEAYGDAKNLGLRHPRAALGYLFVLDADAWASAGDTAAWLLDQLAKLGREDDAYDAVCLVVPEVTANDPKVAVRNDLVPHELSANRFFQIMATTVIDSTPVGNHKEARARLRSPRGA